LKSLLEKSVMLDQLGSSAISIFFEIVLEASSDGTAIKAV
jgi:ribonuclease PH